MVTTINGSGVSSFGGNLTTALRGISNSSVPSGSILQVQQAIITGVFSTTSTTFADITGLGVSITPFSSTSKILVMASMYRGSSAAAVTCFRLTRSGTAVYVGDPASTRSPSSGAYYVGNGDNVSQISAVEFKFLDSPATTSAITYQVQMHTQGGEVVYIGRSGGDGDSAAVARTPASIIVMEVAQ